MKNTKERILEMALVLFSQKGYEGTSIRDITAALGLTKSALYRHYKSKEDIWHALLDEMIAYYDAHFGSANHLPPIPTSHEAFLDLVMRMVNFTIHDEKVVMTRKLLQIEQYRDDRARALATKHFLTGLSDMFAVVFASMMENGLLRQDDAAMVAFAFTAPVSSLIHLCDREPEKKASAIAQIERFTEHFVKTYGLEKQ